MKLSDEVIIRRCLEGDGNAFSLLVEKYQNAVYGLCYHIVGNFADAQDLTQESFIQAYLDLTQIKIPSKFASWLYRVTVNVCKMWLRNR
jgi:RNA polymerase sigma factor (sigma-70 family)